MGGSLSKKVCGQWEDSGNGIRPVSHRGVILLVGSFDSARALHCTFRLTTKALTVSRYTTDQKNLLKRVSELRLGRGLTFKRIAQTLGEQGILSSKGVLLTAQNVYSVLKKGMLRKRRLASKARVKLINLQVENVGQV